MASFQKQVILSVGQRWRSPGMKIHDRRLIKVVENSPQDSWVEYQAINLNAKVVRVTRCSRSVFVDWIYNKQAKTVEAVGASR